MSLWDKYNVRRAAATPAKAALTVGGKTLAQYKAEVEGLPGKMLAVEKSESVLRDARSDLRVLAARVDTNNKRWYAAWSGEFSAGSPEREALGQIDTGSAGGSDAGGDGGGGNSGGGDPGPQLPVGANVSVVSGDGTATATIQFDAAGADTFDIFVKEPGTNDFVLHAESIPDHQYVFTSVAGAPWQVYVVGKNAVGDGPPSATVSFSGPV